jgi:hypothetical protein
MAIWDICNTARWYILWPFGNFVVILYISPRFGTLSQEKSGKPGFNFCSFYPQGTCILHPGES